MKDSETERVRARRHAEPREIVVGYDALAVYVHKDNPLDSISLEDLAEIYGEGGKITRWSQLGVDPANWATTRSSASAGKTAPAPTSTSARR